MKVAELIDILGRLPADSRVVLPHFYGGFSELSSVYSTPIRRALVASMADAPYEGADPVSDAPFVPDETAIVLDVAKSTT
jgi:hypothetical protein